MYSIFRNLALILISAKFFALLARKCRAPQVVGEIIAGLVIGPCLLNLVQPSDSIAIFAEIGVVLLMFTTGLGTNLQELMRAGPIATLIACVGVAVPLAGGTLLYSLFYGFSALGLSLIHILTLDSSPSRGASGETVHFAGNAKASPTRGGGTP